MPEAKDDPRLGRLFTYTVFHLGVYIPLGVAALSLLSSESLAAQLAINVDTWAFRVVIAGLVIAGASGAVIGTSCISALKYEDIWNNKIGAFGIKLLHGKRWADLEHGAFWVAVIALIILTMPGAIPASFF